MIVYLAATLLSVGFAWLAERRPDRSVLRFVAALPLALVAACRWNVGTDLVYTYLPQFTAVEWFRAGGGADLAERLFRPLIEAGGMCVIEETVPLEVAKILWKNFSIEEPGYRALMEAIVWCGGSFRWFIALTSFATVALVFTAIWRQCRRPALAVYFFVATSGYFVALNIVRQYLAIALVLVALSFAVDRRFWRFLLTVILAASFHLSALLAAAFWFLSRVRIAPVPGFVLVALAGAFSFIAPPVLTVVLPWFGLSRYVCYFSTAYVQDGFEGMFFALNLCFMALGAWYYRRANAQSRYFAVWYGMTVLGTMALALSGSVPLMKRVNFLMAAPQFMMLPEILAAEEDGRRRRILTALAVLAFAAETVLAVGFMNKNEPLPYRVLPVAIQTESAGESEPEI